MRWDTCSLKHIYFLDELSAFYLQHPCMWEIEGCCQMKSTIDQIISALLTFGPSWTMKTTQCTVHTLFNRSQI